jgi:hypothetical protein
LGLAPGLPRRLQDLEGARLPGLTDQARHEESRSPARPDVDGVAPARLASRRSREETTP